MTEPVILGRQPEVLYFTPSRPNPWYGTIVEGERFTVEQSRELTKRGLDARTVETMTVKRNCTSREMYFPLGVPVPEYHFECPVLGRRADGWVSVITPMGATKYVAPNGYINGRPATIRSAFR